MKDLVCNVGPRSTQIDVAICDIWWKIALFTCERRQDRSPNLRICSHYPVRTSKVSTVYVMSPLIRLIQKVKINQIFYLQLLKIYIHHTYTTHTDAKWIKSSINIIYVSLHWVRRPRHSRSPTLCQRGRDARTTMHISKYDALGWRNESAWYECETEPAIQCRFYLTVKIFAQFKTTPLINGAVKLNSHRELVV